MISWLDARDAQQFGITLADFFMERIPLEEHNKKIKSLAKKQAVLDKIFLQVQVFKTKNKLNIYKKARLGNAFKWKLLDANYDPALVDELTKLLMLKC
jgi:lipoprotein NlpI